MTGYGVICALLAAMLFGASTPFAKLLVADLPPVLLAGLLYLGSGLGLGCLWLLRRFLQPHRVSGNTGLKRPDLPWLMGATLCGGIVGPVLLMQGLTQTSASAASLTLNLENVFTALIAWFVFRENFDRRILLGMLCIVAGSLLLTWAPGTLVGSARGILLVAGACLCWAIDNNLTRRISASDAVQIAGIKGLVAGSTNVALAHGLGESWPAIPQTLAAASIGFLGYGLSLVLFVLALRHLGTARTGAYFSAAPFVGALVAIALLGEQPASSFWLAFSWMGLGLWLHLTEQHNHLHTHQPHQHSHSHRHDEHHQHAHDFDWDGSEPHTHIHDHAPLTHQHSHYPDIHHRHSH